MPIVDYPVSAAYKHIPGLGMVPAVEVILSYGQRQARTTAVLDSGSPLTIFNRQHAELLGILDVTTGNLQRVSTLGGPFDCYLFDLEMEVRTDGHASRFPAQIAFFAGRIPRNILGRNIFFARYEVGFRESHQVIHLKAEDH